MATRTERLAQPKPDHLRYPDRRSVYWLDHLPPEKTGSITKTELTPRWLELCRNKKSYAPITLSPTWEVSKWALQAVASDRLCRLAKPLQPAAGWQPDRPLLAPLRHPTTVRNGLTRRLNTNKRLLEESRATQTAMPTSRICQLAQPRRRPVLEGDDHKPKPEPTTHISYRASAHIELLATPKHDHTKFREERPVSWIVSKAARNYVASKRVLELSSPKERTALFEGYDPYVVSRAARSASSSPRIQQLSLPLPRKCSSKKEG